MNQLGRSRTDCASCALCVVVRAVPCLSQRVWGGLLRRVSGTEGPRVLALVGELPAVALVLWRWVMVRVSEGGSRHVPVSLACDGTMCACACLNEDVECLPFSSLLAACCCVVSPFACVSASVCVVYSSFLRRAVRRRWTVR